MKKLLSFLLLLSLASFTLGCSGDPGEVEPTPEPTAEDQKEMDEAAGDLVPEGYDPKTNPEQQ